MHLRSANCYCAVKDEPKGNALLTYISRYQPLIEQFREFIRRDEPLNRHTVARLGGPADVLIKAESMAVLVGAVRLCWQEQIPVRVIGGGANVLFSNQGYRGLILINNVKTMRFSRSGMIVASSGVSLAQLARESMARGLAGFEWAISVPGTLGGAVVNNAGAHGSDIAASFRFARIASEGEAQTCTWGSRKLDYRYRESALKQSQTHYLVESAALRLSPGHDPAELRARADDYIAHRKRTQPPGASLGSMFKNPPGDYAGRLIEAAGLKGVQAGGVIISPIHANFFVNTGGGMASDYVSLIRLAQKTVRERFGVSLELEIELIGEGFAEA